MNTRGRLATALLLATIVPGSLASQQILTARVVVLSPDENDERIGLALEAIAFWNDSFVELGLEPLFADTEVVVSSPVTRVLENHARRVSQRAGRVVPGPREPAPPQELMDIDADVVLFLSAQNLMSFAWPLAETDRYFIAISETPGVVASTNTTRNVIAHELGHAVGLTHHDDPATLMCLPCESSNLQQGEAAFLPLTANDRARLLELYSPAAD